MLPISSLFVFALASLCLAGLGRLFALNKYLLPLWAVATYSLFFAVADTSAVLLSSGQPDARTSFSDLLGADLYASFIGLPVSIFLLTALAGIQMMNRTQRAKRVWLLCATSLIGVFLALGMSYGIAAVGVGLALGVLIPLPLALNRTPSARSTSPQPAQGV